MIAFTVRGLPQAQGSARAFIAGGRAIVTTEGNRPRSPLGAWRTAVATEARGVMGDTPELTGPLALTVTFSLPRPQSHYGSGRNAGVLKASAPSHVPTKPDVDKLLRAVLDALTGVAWKDDAQVASVHATKTYGDGWTGCRIRLEPLTPPNQED